MIRHGDVLLRPTDLRPSNDGPPGQPATRLVLAEGEATGHAHVIEGNLLQTTRGGRMLLAVLHDVAKLSHEEHGLLPVAPGWYEVIRQRTYSPTAPSQSRWVRD